MSQSEPCETFEALAGAIAGAARKRSNKSHRRNPQRLARQVFAAVVSLYAEAQMGQAVRPSGAQRRDGDRCRLGSPRYLKASGSRSSSWGHGGDVGIGASHAGIARQG